MLMTAVHFVSFVCVVLPTLCVLSHCALFAVSVTNLFVGSQGDGLFFFTFGWCSHERTQSTDAPNEQCRSAGGVWLD